MSNSSKTKYIYTCVCKFILAHNVKCISYVISAPHIKGLYVKTRNDNKTYPKALMNRCGVCGFPSRQISSSAYSRKLVTVKVYFPYVTSVLSKRLI